MTQNVEKAGLVRLIFFVVVLFQINLFIFLVDLEKLNHE